MRPLFHKAFRHQVDMINEGVRESAPYFITGCKENKLYKMDKAIKFAADTWNGGTVYLFQGTYITAAAVDLSYDNVHLMLDRHAIIEKKLQ